MRLLTFIFLFIFLPESVSARLPDLIPYRKGALWGFSDSTKKILIEPKWDEVTFFGKNAAAVKRNGLWGMIDRKGVVILSTVYSWISEDNGHGVRIVSLLPNGNEGAVNDSGHLIIPIRYEWILFRGPYLEANGKHKCGIIDSTGRIIIPFNFQPLDKCASMGDSGLFPMQQHGKMGVIDTGQNVIVPFIYYFVEAISCGQFIAIPREGPYVYYNSKGQVVTKLDSCPNEDTWRGYNQLVNGMQSFSADTGRLYGYRNAQGKVIFEPEFGIARDFEPNGLALVWCRAPGTKRGAAEQYIDIHGTKYWED